MLSEAPELDLSVSWSLSVPECLAGSCRGTHSFGDFGDLMSLWPADTLLGHPVLLTESSELDKSGSSVSLWLLAGLSLKLGKEGCLGVSPFLPRRWVGVGRTGFCCSASLLISGRLEQSPSHNKAEVKLLQVYHFSADFSGSRAGQGSGVISAFC